MRKEKTCPNCFIVHKYSTILCQNCNVTKRKYGTFTPDHRNITCKLCNNIFVHKYKNALYCPDCRLKYNLITCRKIKRPKNDIKKTRAKNGTGTTTRAGYRQITRVGHANSGANGKIQEHTFVMSEYLDRPLDKHESVHHKNGIRHDNRIENLELWSRYQPIGQRVEDLLSWAREIILKYEGKC